MKNLKERIKKYAVKLKSENNDLGSGVLWKSASCPENSLYVFTAAHVIKDYKDISVEFEKDGEVVEVCVTEVLTSGEYKKEGDKDDVAILILNYEYKEFQEYKIIEIEKDLNTISENPQLSIVGFPKEGSINTSFRLSKDILLCRYEDYDKTMEMVKYKFVDSNIDNSDKNAELEGFSGSGIFAEIDSEPVLIGIHKGALGQNVARGNLIGTVADCIRKICQIKGCELPEKLNEINGNLSDRKEYFMENVCDSDLAENFDDYRKVLSLLNDILKQDVAPKIDSAFCDFCEECEHKTNYHKCIYFRGFLLSLLVFLKIINEEISLNSEEISKLNEIPIYFVCSEGKGGSRRDKQTQLKLSHFIYALKSKNLLTYNLKNKCIIIWGSERMPRDDQRKCGCAKYKNILRDVTRIPQSDLDITTVYSEAQPQAIIHINEIINMLRSGEIEHMKEKFTEYIKELEK